MPMSFRRALWPRWMGFAAWRIDIWPPVGGVSFPKGERYAEEVEIARKTWAFDLEARENLDHKGSALLVLRNLRRAE